MRKHSTRDASKARLTVMGTTLRNSPIVPGRSTSGIKAAMVVNVDVNDGRQHFLSACDNSIGTLIAHLQVAIDVFYDDDRIVYDHTQHQNETE